MLASKDSNTSEHGGHIQRWNPMEADFLAPKNNYAYDDEDASIAIQGYSEYNINKWKIYTLNVIILESSSRICRFYETSKGCMKGADCQFLHLEEGVVSLFICWCYHTCPLPTNFGSISC